MATFDELCMVSDHILLIILSNCSCHVSYRIGVLSKCLVCIVEMPTHTHIQMYCSSGWSWWWNMWPSLSGAHRHARGSIWIRCFVGWVRTCRGCNSQCFSCGLHLVRYAHVLVAITHYFSSQPFTDYFPRADIHELISPDILHQLVKGAFKDHVVTWIHSYIKAKHGEQAGNRILDDIDWRYFFFTQNLWTEKWNNF